MRTPTPTLPTPALPTPPLDGRAIIQRDALTLSILYHTLAVDGQTGLEMLEQLMDQAEAEYRPAFAEQIVTTAASQRLWLAPAQGLYIDYMAGRLDQLLRRWPQSQRRFEELLGNGELVAVDLRARIQRDLGKSLAEQMRWSEAIALQETALNSFKAQNNPRETAFTMNALGESHLGMALGAWGGGEPFSVERSTFQLWVRRIFRLPVLLLRLPVLIYLASQMGLRSILSGSLRIGSGLDWLIARLFAGAARWFQQAQRRFIEGDVGLAQVEENLGDLHLALNNSGAAVQAWQKLLSDPALPFDEYRRARAQLGLAQAQIQSGNVDEASAILTQIEPIFARYGHRRRLAQTYTFLAQCRVLQGENSHALELYQSALTLWQQESALSEATDVLHQIEEIDPSAAQSIGNTLPRRRYNVRFRHPLLVIFQNGALIALTAFVLLMLFSSVRTESGTRIDSTPALVQPVEASVEEEFGPAVRVSFNQQLQPDLNTIILWQIILVGLGGYLLLYTLIGLVFINRTPLASIKSIYRSTLTIDEDGITHDRSETRSVELRWNTIQSMVVADRFKLGALGSIFSSTYLRGQDEHGIEHTIWIPGVTNRYNALQSMIRSRLGQTQAGQNQSSQSVAFYNTGFSLFRSLTGWIFLTSVGLLLSFLLLSQIDLARAFLTFPLLFGYSLSDLYPLNYVVIGVLLVWWFVAQPLRTRMLLEPDTPWLFAAVLGGIGLASWALLRLLPTVANFERPDVAPALLALMLLLPTAWHIWQQRNSINLQSYPLPQPQDTKSEKMQVRALPLRILIIAVLFAMPLLWYGGREVVSYHFAVQGNHARNQAEVMRESDQPAANLAYERAITHYTRSLDLRTDAAVVNSRAAVLNRMGRYRDAIAGYEQARLLDPAQWVYGLNVGLAYEQWATQVVTPAKKIEYYQSAIERYSVLLDETERAVSSAAGDSPSVVASPLPTPQVSLSGKQEIDIHLFRGNANYGLARTWRLAKDDEKAAQYYRAAYEDYDWLINNVDQPEATYYAGRGYAALFLIDKGPATAVEDFEKAVAIEANYSSAYTGLAWGNYYQINKYNGCQSAQRNGFDPTRYAQHTQAAIDAISQAIRLQPQSGTHYRTRAQLRFLLRDCAGYNQAEVFRAAIEDYEQALRIRPDNDDWWFSLAKYRLALVLVIDDTIEKTQQRLEAGLDLIKAAELNPGEPVYWLRLAYVYYALDTGGAGDPALLLVAAAKPILAGPAAAGADAAISAIASRNDGVALERFFRALGDAGRAGAANVNGDKF